MVFESPATVRTVSRGREPGDAYYTRVDAQEPRDQLDDCEQCGEGDCGFSTVQREKWVHVGAGQGSYSKTNQMLFVGERHGAYEKEHVVHHKYGGCSCGNVFCMLLGMILTVLAGYGIGLLLQNYFVTEQSSMRTLKFSPFDSGAHSAGKTHHVHPASGYWSHASTATSFDCNVEKESWDLNWSEEKKAYCCAQTKQEGCSSDPFDCELQKDSYKTAWTSKKTAYCCDKHGVACDHAALGCDRLCSIFGQTASCKDRAMHAFSKVGSCAKAHKEVLDLCWVCNACPLNGLQCHKEGEEKVEEAIQDDHAKGPRLPCERPLEDGFMWKFESSGREWKQHRIPDGVHKNPAGRGFMWLQDGSTWKQVCIPNATSLDMPKTPVGDGFIWHRRSDLKGPIWEQIPAQMRHGGIGEIPRIPAGPGLQWKHTIYGWTQEELPKEMQNPSRPCNTRAGPGMRWVFQERHGKVWEQLLIPGWIAKEVNPQPAVPPGRGFMWSFEPQDYGWTQICIPGWSDGQPEPPSMDAGTGFMWLQQGGAWHQVPVPRGLRGLCADQPAKHFLPAGRGFMWKCTRKHGLLAWHQVHRNNWHRDGPTRPPHEEAGNGLMWVYQDQYWQQQRIPRWHAKDAPDLPAGPGLMWSRDTVDGKRVWKQALIPDWEVDNKLHPPAQPAGEGMMWRYSEKDGRKEWSQEGIGDWYADSANHPPTEYAGNGLMWKFSSVGGNPGKWHQVDIPDWHVLDQFEQPTVVAGPGFMWTFDKDIGRWTQLPIPKWKEERSEDKPIEVPAGEGYMWKFYQENGSKNWHQVQMSKTDLLRPHPEPSEPAGNGFRWQYNTDSDRNHWEQVLVKKASCTGVLCHLGLG